MLEHCGQSENHPGSFVHTFSAHAKLPSNPTQYSYPTDGVQLYVYYVLNLRFEPCSPPKNFPGCSRVIHILGGWKSQVNRW